MNIWSQFGGPVIFETGEWTHYYIIHVGNKTYNWENMRIVYDILGAYLLSFAHDFATLHFALFCDRIFELQLLAQFLTDFPKICTMYLPMCNLYDWYLIYLINSLF